MGEATPTSWWSGLALLAVCAAILLLGWQIGGGEDSKPVHVQLSCQHYADGRYDCVQP